MNAETTAAADTRQASLQATVQAIRDHHERLGRTVADHALTIRRSVDQLASPTAARERLVTYIDEEILPHASAEEQTLYHAAAELPETRLLVQAMTREHVILRDLAVTLAAARTAGEAAGAGAALDALFQAHLEKENDILLPALAEAGIDLPDLLDGMHLILGEPDEGGCCGGHCACGGHDDAGTPGAVAVVVGGELDVRKLAHAQRHQQIFAAYEELPSGTAFVLVNDHDPKPLYYQFAAEYAGNFTWDYVESGPQVWRVRIGRP